MYLVTGATGFLGKHLIDALVAREGTIHCVVRESSQPSFREVIAERWPQAAGRIVLVSGDITQPNCGVSDKDLKGSVRHMFHLAALYDMDADAEACEAANVSGTRNACALAQNLGATLHYTSSIAVAGDYKGFFREDMFNEGQKHPHPYFKTKFLAEQVVRQECKAPYRIYRPGIVVGSSQTGEADKIDGIYYAFKSIQRLRSAVPQWVPLIGFEGSVLHIVPVDFVTRALDAIAHKPGEDGKTFHLVDPNPLSFGDAINELCTAAHAPRFSARVDPRVLNLVPKGALALLGAMPAVRGAKKEVFDSLGIPESVMPYMNWRSSFDTRDTDRVLEGTGISCPPLSGYAWRLWDHWERQMDPDLFIDRSLRGCVEGKICMVTGASSGIGKAVALRLGQAGGRVILVARSEDKLLETKAAIEAAGGEATIEPCDLAEEKDCDRLIAQVLDKYGHVDVLINNAGRSIRRSISHSYDRYHDFQRTMQLNYFGSLKLILGFLPKMRERRSGQIINVSSIGVQTNAPRFSAYIASKAALDAFSRSIASEVVAHGIYVTTIYMPLVRTPMIAPTKIYDAFPTRTPEEAADMIIEGLIGKRKRVATRLGTFGEVSYALAPKLIDRVLNTGYRLFPDSKKAHDTGQQTPPSVEAMAFAHLLKGIHW